MLCVLPLVVEENVLLHECGHSIDIIEHLGGYEQYFSNTYCCMALVSGDNVNNPWYCQHH